MYRDNTKVVKIGNVAIGGGNKIAIQSMTNTKTEDVKATVEQILALEKAGCDIVRSTVPTMEAAKAIADTAANYWLQILVLSAAVLAALILVSIRYCKKRKEH